ncbi:hypothetical protein [Acidovorax sp. JHL-9]|uniref:hypothetical protein n=1 Tax=Acidovorax sp. JHL-9 TaxID=1276756 RepID=UPI00047C3404|nr:hypothetical protein [Acidovorax sp. JHL-9]
MTSIADRLWQAKQTGETIAPVRDLIAQLAVGGDLLTPAYRALQVNTQRRIDGGARLVGRKIGLTSVAVQRQLGVDALPAIAVAGIRCHPRRPRLCNRAPLCDARWEAALQRPGASPSRLHARPSDHPSFPTPFKESA